MAKFCKKCGSPVTEGAKFCKKCGYKFEIAVSAPTVEMSVAPAGPTAAEKPVAPVGPTTAIPAVGAVKPVGKTSGGKKSPGSGRVILTTIGVTALWIVQTVLIRKGIENPFTKFLNLVTFAKGSMGRGIAGYIGGTLGMSVVASALITVFGGGLKTIGAGFKSLFSGRTPGGSLGLSFLGMTGAFALYFIYTGTMYLSGVAAGVAGILVCIRTLGCKGGGLYRFVSNFTSKRVNGEKVQSPGAARSLMSGAVTGFTLAMIVAGLFGFAGI